jgi:hypothetical protein
MLIDYNVFISHRYTHPKVDYIIHDDHAQAAFKITVLPMSDV